MNRYSRIFHHITVEDVKKSLQKKEESHKSFLNSVREARTFLRDLNSPHYSNWREPHLNEGMTTAGMMYTTFPSTGESNLENIDTGNAGSFTAAGDNAALNGTVVRASGSGEGSDGGFDVGGNYLGFEGSTDSRWAILNPIDSSKFDTLVLRAIRGDDNNGGEDPDVTGEELRLYYLEPNGSSFKSITVNPAGDQALPADADVIIPLSDGTPQSLRDWTINLPSYARGEGFTYMLFQLSHSGSEFDHFGVTSVKYQRRNPISLFISLDSPEATAFIGGGSNLTPEQKKKRLEDMLAASDEYMEKQFPTNQEAVERAKRNLQRNIDISLDPDTFKFPEYRTPEYYDMFPSYIDDQSSTERIDRYLEQRGLTVDNLDKDFNKSKGTFTSLGQEGTLLLLNNPDTQERTLTAMGIDPGLVTNYTPDSWEKIRKITNLRPGGTPATGWDGKFYRFNDPQLEASQVIPLETYLQVKGTDNYLGVERPDRAEPGKRYVMEKEYNFSDPKPTYVGVRNKDIEERYDRTHYIASVGADMYVGGHKWDFTLYTKDADLKGSKYMLQQLTGSATRSLNYINQNSEFLAYDFLRKYQNGENGYTYVDLYNQYKDTDIFNNYDPLWVWNSNPTMTTMLGLLRSISSGRSLDSSYSDYGDNYSAWKSHQTRNDRLYDDLQKALRLFDTPRTLSQYEKDEWYYGRDDDRVTEVRTTHPYSGLPEPGEEPQEPQEPTEPEEKNYPPELNDLGGKAWESGNTITKEGFKKADGDFDIFAAGGGNAKMAQGFTYEQVMEIGRKNLNVLSVKGLDNKTNTKFQYKNGNLNPIGYSVANERINNALNYSSSLAMTLGISILTGQSREIKLGDRGRQDMIQSVNPSVFGSALKIGPAIRPTVDNAVNPTPGKKLNVFNGLWGEPGAAEVDYDPATDTLTFTSNKMLRKGKGDQYNDIGTVITRFGDIPTPTQSDITNRSAAIITNMYGAVGINPPSGQSKEKFIPQLAKSFTNNQLANAVIGAATQVIDYTMQGTASNIVALRNLMTNAGLVRPSAMEKTYGGYGHVYTQTSYTGSQIPQELRQIINRRMGKETLGGGSLGDTLQGIDAADAAATAGEKKKKTNTVAAEMYEPKAKHNDKVAKVTGRLKSVSDFLNHPDVKPVFPKDPPPEMINGRHPDLVDGEKVSNRFNRLDPISAKAMPKTGNPKIDAKVAKVLKKPK